MFSFGCCLPLICLSSSLINHLYQPAASISVHVAVDFYWFGAVIVDIDSVDATLLIAILHDLNAVHGEGVQKTN